MTLPGHSPSLKKIRVRTQGRNLKQKPQGMLFTRVVSGYTCSFRIHPKTSYLGMVPPTVGLVLQYLAVKTTPLHHTHLIKTVFQLRVPFPRCVKITIKTSSHRRHPSPGTHGIPPTNEWPLAITGAKGFLQMSQFTCASFSGKSSSRTALSLVR